MLQLIINGCRCHSLWTRWTPHLWLSDERQTVFHGKCPPIGQLRLQATASQSKQAPAGFTAQNQGRPVVCVWRHSRSAIGVAHHNVKSERCESRWATFTVSTAPNHSWETGQEIHIHNIVCYASERIENKTVFFPAWVNHQITLHTIPMSDLDKY